MISYLNKDFIINDSNRELEEDADNDLYISNGKSYIVYESEYIATDDIY